MTATVQDFIADKLPPITSTTNNSTKDAVRRMIEHDFSQLPVINDHNVPIGVITSDSILKALSNYGVSLDGVRVKHVMVRNPQLFNQNIDLFDLFDYMRDSYALITDDDNRLVGIVTSYDLTQYFRQRAQDIMLVENVESTLKDYIQMAFTSEPDKQSKLDQAIQSMTNSSEALRRKFESALRNYLGLVTSDNGLSFVQELAERTFEKYLDDKRDPVTFDELTLGHYVDLFMYNEHWSRLEDIFELDKNAMKNLLDSVRQTRNDLAHFRDITRDQSYQLRDCYDLLTSHQDAISKVFIVEEAPVIEESGETEPEIDHDIVQQVTDIQPVADEPSPGESRYAAIAIWLQSQPPDRDLVHVTFARIEEIIEGKLPESAYKHRAWWANDSVGHTQSQLWLEVGWRVASVNMSEQTVRFARIQERQKAYIEFYSALINDLRKKPEFEHLKVLPDGVNWHWVKSMSVNGKGLASFTYSFGRGQIFRIELYIDSGNREINKQLFDGLLAQKDEIEDKVGQELTWQRLDKRRASRVALLFNGSIIDSEEELAKLRQKAVPAMVQFVQIMEPRAEAVAQEILA